MNEKEYFKEIEKATAFCIKAHDGQYRKDNTPYCSHPISVWLRVKSLGTNDLVLEIAALLHDVIEDTKYTAFDIKDRFGAEPGMIVTELTNSNILPYKERRSVMIAKAKNMSNRAKIVKCFDRIHNLEDGERSFSPEKLLSYTKEAILLHESLSKERPKDSLHSNELQEFVVIACNRLAECIKKVINNQRGLNAEYEKLFESMPEV